MSKPQSNTHRIEVTSHLRWVRLDQMKVNPQAQRDLSQSWADELAKDFDPDKMGFIHTSFRDGWYYVIDGQHRRQAAIAYLGSDQQVQCHVYEGLTVEQEAKLFLALNRQRQQGAMSKYKVALTAGSPVECDVDRIARALGLKIGASAQLEEITCVTALLTAYKKRGPGPLAFALRMIRDAYGYDGFKREVINGLTLVIDRYGNRVDEQQLIKRLMADGLIGLHRRGKDLRNSTGAAAEQCYACAIVESFNRARGGSKLQPWWNFQQGGAA
ncbi:DUF6551 family protein [Antrihabitans sp. NCIMB 15449]|uniref:DUF6551 family protein n=1 Tax=Antrihabitans spumae TaxID=3373370 RepID=A0ABW7JMJ6_9NOCA